MGRNKNYDLGSVSAKMRSLLLQTRYYIHHTASKIRILVPGLPNRQSYSEKLDILLSLNASRGKKKIKKKGKFVSLCITTFFTAFQTQDLRFLWSQSVLLIGNKSALVW